MDQYVADQIYFERLLLKPILDWARRQKAKPESVIKALERFDEEIGDRAKYWNRRGIRIELPDGDEE